MDMDLIFDLFRTLSGLSSDEAEEMRPLCELSAMEIDAMLRPDVDESENSERICYAVAATALCKFCVTRAARESGTVRIGEITVTRDEDAARSAHQIRDDAISMISDLIDSRGFYFGTV